MYYTREIAQPRGKRKRKERERIKRAALKIGIRVTYSRYVTISEMGTSWTATSQFEKRVMNEWTFVCVCGRRRLTEGRRLGGRVVARGSRAISHGKLNGQVSAHKAKSYDGERAL